MVAVQIHAVGVTSTTVSEGLVTLRVRIKENEGGKETREVGAGIQTKN